MIKFCAADGDFIEILNNRNFFSEKIRNQHKVRALVIIDHDRNKIAIKYSTITLEICRFSAGNENTG